MTKRGLVYLFLAIITLWAGGQSPRAEEQAKASPLGDKLVNSKSLRDLHGNLRSLTGFKDNKAIVIFFLGADCPVSNLYVPGVVELEKRYRGKQVQFLAVYPSPQDDLDGLAAHAYDRDIPFPVLMDAGQR